MQWNDLHVRLMHPQTGQLLREQLRAPRGWHRIAEADRSARTPASTLTLLARAATAGPHIGTVCRHIQAHAGAHGVRQILGVLALAKKHGVAVVDDAAKAAIDIGVRTYRFVRKYVDRQPPLPLTLLQVDPLIRQLTLYRALIAMRRMRSSIRPSLIGPKYTSQSPSSTSSRPTYSPARVWVTHTQYFKVAGALQSEEDSRLIPAPPAGPSGVVRAPARWCRAAG